VNNNDLSANPQPSREALQASRLGEFRDHIVTRDEPSVKVNRRVKDNRSSCHRFRSEWNELTTMGKCPHYGN
jgi:hypothetical protein